MKRMMKFGLALFFIVFAAPVWAHHAAEGIVSDEVWLMIDANLEGTPHQDIDFDDIMESMSTGPCPDDASSLCLITQNVIPSWEEEAYMDAVETLMTDLENPQSPINQVPSGKGINQRSPSLSIVIDDNLDGTLTVTVFEPLGSGMDEPGSDAPKTGTRADG